MIATSSMTVFILYWFGFMALWLVVGAGTYLAMSFVSGGRKKTKHKKFTSNRYEEEARSKFYALQLEEIVDTWKTGSDNIPKESLEEALAEDGEEVLNEAEIKYFQNAEMRQEIENFTNQTAAAEEESVQEKPAEEEPAKEEPELEKEFDEGEVLVNDRAEEEKKWRSAEEIFSGLFKV